MKKNKRRSLALLRQRVFRMVSIGVLDDTISRSYDVISSLALILNLTAAICSTFAGLEAKYGTLFRTIESVTVFFFAVDYALRLFTANNLYPDLPEGQSLLRYLRPTTSIRICRRGSRCCAMSSPSRGS